MSTPFDRPPAWVADAVFYQIFPDRFAWSEEVGKPDGLEPWDAPPTRHGFKGGDLVGIAERLDYLSDLGITALYLNPIFQSTANHRYHTHDYYRVDPILGGKRAFRRLLDDCHERGMRVVLDGVFNHASRGFFQFSDLLENGPESPWIDWFNIKGWPLHAYDDAPPNYDAWWGIQALPEFNTDNPDVREYLMQVGEHWARQGIDGWRLDVPGEIVTPGFWEEFRERTRKVNPDLYLVGELWHNAADWITAGDRFDGTMNYILTGFNIRFAAGELVRPGLAETVSYAVHPPMDASTYGDHVESLLHMYPEHAHRANLNLLASHDTPRLSTLAGGDRQSVVLAALLMLTFPGAPCIYYGDEVGVAGRHDPDNRRTFPWDESRWDEELRRAFQSLIALRHEHPALRSTGYRRLWPPAYDNGPMLYVFLREEGDDRVLVAVNAGREKETASLSAPDLHAGSLTMIWGDGEADRGENTVRLSVPARTAGIWQLHG